MKVKKILVSIILVLLFLFVIANIMWFYFRSKYFSQIAERSTLFTTYSKEINSYYYDEYDTENNITYSYTITFPRYLRFGNGYSVSTSLNYNEDMTGYDSDYIIVISIRPHLFGKNTYTVNIGDLKNANNTSNLEYNTYTFEVDENMKIIKEFSYGGSEVFTSAYPEVLQLFKKAKAVFHLES